jgi:hypothetical protein
MITDVKRSFNTYNNVSYAIFFYWFMKTQIYLNLE